VSDYLLLKKYCNINLYVVRANYTDFKVLKTMNELYESGKIENVNIVLNDMDYTQSYEYSYMKKAGYYYKDKKKKDSFVISVGKKGKKPKVYN
jgi:Mrp family chromosome partitioning ATPase